MKRTHIQFSGSLRPEDAEAVLAILKPAIERRPENCGSILRVRDFGTDDPDVAEEDKNGIVICFADLRDRIEANQKEYQEAADKLEQAVVSAGNTLVDLADGLLKKANRLRG